MWSTPVQRLPLLFFQTLFLLPNAPTQLKCTPVPTKRFQRWLQQSDINDDLPSDKYTITTYLLSMLQVGKSVAVLQQFVQSARWMHHIAGYHDPTSSHMIRTVMEGARRLSTTSSQKKKPFTPGIMQDIHLNLLDNKQRHNLTGLRNMAFILVAFAGFLRYDDIIRLTRQDVAFYKTHMDLFLASSKTDTYRDGHTVTIARTNTTLDPYVFLAKYLKKAHIPANDHRYIFRGIYLCKSTGLLRLKHGNKHISYSTVRDMIAQQVVQIGLEPQGLWYPQLTSWRCNLSSKQGSI